ncbi:MAG: SIR2 family protein [Lachnospiraceae bacterium]|nr:SIR2 family protein [Lachnospiraceae bacterium]
MDTHIELSPALPKGIIEAYERHELAVFVGAGISRLMGCQGWDQMANALVDKVCTPAMADQVKSSCSNSKEKITIAKRIAEKEHKTADFWEVFRGALSPDPKKEDIYAKIALFDTLFLTTNCDGLLVEKFPYSYTTDCSKDEYLRRSDKPFVYCLHGNWGNGTVEEKERLIFTEDKYLSEYQPGNQLPIFLKQVMHDKTVLFIGYGLTEFEIINAAFEPVPPLKPLKHYLLEGFFKYQQELCNAKAEYFASIGVNLIPYSKDECGYAQQARIISEWIDELKNKTSYNSRGILAVLEALDDFSVKNCHDIEQRLGRPDSLKDLTAMLDALPQCLHCYDWIIFLFDKEIINPDEIPVIKRINEKSYSYVNWPILPCILSCIKRKEPAEHEKLRITEFVKKAIAEAYKNENVQKNQFVINQLWEVYLNLGKLPEDDIEMALWNAWASSSDWAISLMERNYCGRVIECARDKAAQLFCAFFASGEIENQEHRSYWFPKLAQEISSFHDNQVLERIIEYCLAMFLEAEEPNPFYRSFDDRYHFVRSGYAFSLYNSIEIFLENMDSETQTRIISGLLRKADSTDTWQFSLHLAAKVSQGKVSDFAENPLSFSHVFVDFYIWLDSFLASSHYDDADVGTLIDWISQASFGYDLEKENTWYDTSIKWVNTWRYLLFDLLSRVNPRVAELRDQIKEEVRFDEKTPIEDKERYYTVRDVPLEEHFANDDFSTYSAEELYGKIVVEKEKSVWSNEYYYVRELIEEMGKKISDSQLCSFVDFMLSKSGDELCAVASLLFDDSIVCRIPSDTLKSFIQRLYEIICELDVTAKERAQLTSSFVYALQQLSKIGWKQKEIGELLLSFDPARLFVNDEPYHENMDVIMNIINVAESQFFSLTIDSIAACKEVNDLKEQFYAWFTDAIKNNPGKWLIYACAFRIQNLLYLDKKKTKSLVIPVLRSAEDAAGVALAMCSGTSVIIPLVVNFCAPFEMIDDISLVIKKDGREYRNADCFITYMVAAYHFGLLPQEKYRHFLQTLEEDAMNHVAWTICEGIKGIEEKQCYMLIDETLRMIIDDDSKAQYAKGIINYLSRKERITEDDWKVICPMIDLSLSKSGLWHSIEDCLEKTDNLYDDVISSIDKMTNYSETIYEFNADKIICELARLKGFSSIQRFAWKLVERNLNPGKYSQYGENPEKAIELLDKD